MWGVSANEYSCAHGAQINFGDLTPYLTYGAALEIIANFYEDWQLPKAFQTRFTWQLEPSLLHLPIL
jgi:hypothetical protein